MRNLVYKELKLSIHSFFFVLPLILALLLLIPQWIFLLAFSYFFWISVSTIFSGYNSKEDLSFCFMLPVTKKDIVKSKIYSYLIIQSIHILAGLIVGILHNYLYGSQNMMLDINIAFFGIVLGMYSLFNIIFLPLYFKTAYFFGKPQIYGSLAALLYAALFEVGIIYFESFKDIFEGAKSTQLLVLAIGIVLSVIVNYITIERSVKNFESIV